MNRVVLAGRLTRDAEVHAAANESGVSVVRFTVAVDRRGRANADGTRAADFIGCVAFGKTGEALAQYLKKGDGIVLDGHIQTGSYTNQNGQKIYTTDVIVDNWEFPMSRRGASDAPAAQAGNASENQAAAPAPNPAAAAMPEPGFAVDEEIPFN